MLPATRERVRENTAEEINQQIRQRTERSVMESIAGGPKAIERRLEELYHEWDIELAIEVNAAGFALAGVALGEFADRRFLLLPAAVGMFLLQHALQGWCPPVPILRRLGFRTAREIFEERLALKSLLDRAS